MYCTRKIADEIYWVGGNDRRLALFEAVYPIPNGVSYNSYLIMDEKTILMDTVDKAIAGVFFENIEHVLAGRGLDYLIVQHMEPDHTATLQELVLRHPELTVVCNKMTLGMIKQFFSFDIDSRVLVIEEGFVLSTGKHSFTLFSAPMVHWPEVMVTYESTEKILFSADAFGTFGAINGALFADEVDFMRNNIDEARRYYSNIVGKYGPQVQALLKKAQTLDIEMICPLHGYVWRESISDYIDKYQKWSSYTPEEYGVVIAYASVYGNTENTADIISTRLRERGIKTVMYNVSVTDVSEIVSAAFKYSHIVFASTTYNAGIFIKMDDLLRDIAAHNLQNRTVAFVQNGSWAPTSGKLMRQIIEPLKGTTVIENLLTIKSSLKKSQLPEVDALVDAIAASIPQTQLISAEAKSGETDEKALFKISYGLYVLSAREGDKDNGCIVNTVMQLTDSPKQLAISVNKNNFTHDMIMRSGQFNITMLTEKTPFEIFSRFGFQSGRDTNKFENYEKAERSVNGVYYIPEYANAFISCRVLSTVDLGTHSMFIAELTEAQTLSDEPSVSYTYYQQNIKPEQKKEEDKKAAWVCSICGYVHEGEELPADFICPICKHGAEVFKKQ